MKYLSFCIALLIFVILFMVCCTDVHGQTKPTQLTQPTQYTVVIFTAKWCPYCVKLKQSFESKTVKDLVKSQYHNDLHWIDIDLAQNKSFVDTYKFEDLALPTMVVLKRTSPKEGIILTSQEGYMSSVALANFLRNPGKYQTAQKYWTK